MTQMQYSWEQGQYSREYVHFSWETEGDTCFFSTASANGPFWSKSLWRGDLAPSLLTLQKIGATAACIATGQAWAAPLIVAGLDALDTTANVAMDNMSFEDGLVNMGRIGAKAAIGSLTAGLGSSLTAAWSSSLGAFGGAALSTAVTGSINQVAAIGIDGFNRDGWDVGGWKGFGRKLGNAGISVGISSAAAGISHDITASSGAKFQKLKNGNYGWSRPAGVTGTQWHGMSKIQKYGNLVGGAFKQGGNYALGRDVTLNLLNTQMFGGPDVGFLEFSFNREGKKSFQFGTGGLDVSPGALAIASEGASDIGYLDRMESSYRGLDKVDVVNLQGSSGDATAIATSRAIIEGELQMRFGSEGGYDFALNQGRNDRNNTFYISDRIRSGNLNDVAVGAVVASHEGGHLGYGPITEDDGLDRLYDIDVNVWNGLKKAFGGLQNRELDELARVKRFSSAMDRSDVFYQYVRGMYNVEDPRARQRFDSQSFGMNRAKRYDNAAFRNRYLRSQMIAATYNMFSFKALPSPAVRHGIGRLLNLADRIDEKKGIWPFRDSADHNEALGIIGDFATTASAVNQAAGYSPSRQSAIYNYVYESSGVIAKDLVQEHGKGPAAVMMAKVLTYAPLKYSMGSKIARDGEFQNNYQKYFGDHCAFSATGTLRNTAGTVGTVDCNGFVVDVLRLVGEKYNSFNTRIRDTLAGVKHGSSERYPRGDLGLTSTDKQNLRRLHTLPYQKMVTLMRKINRPGVVMGYPGSGAAGHIWFNTGKWLIGRNNRFIGIYILESAGRDIGTAYRPILFQNRHYFKTTTYARSIEKKKASMSVLFIFVFFSLFSCSVDNKKTSKKKGRDKHKSLKKSYFVNEQTKYYRVNIFRFINRDYSKAGMSFFVALSKGKKLLNIFPDSIYVWKNHDIYLSNPEIDEDGLVRSKILIFNSRGKLKKKSMSDIRGNLIFISKNSSLVIANLRKMQIFSQDLKKKYHVLNFIFSHYTYPQFFQKVNESNFLYRVDSHVTKIDINKSEVILKYRISGSESELLKEGYKNSRKTQDDFEHIKKYLFPKNLNTNNDLFNYAYLRMRWGSVYDCLTQSGGIASRYCVGLDYYGNEYYANAEIKSGKIVDVINFLKTPLFLVVKDKNQKKKWKIRFPYLYGKADVNARGGRTYHVTPSGIVYILNVHPVHGIHLDKYVPEPVAKRAGGAAKAYY